MSDGLHAMQLARKALDAINRLSDRITALEARMDAAEPTQDRTLAARHTHFASLEPEPTQEPPPADADNTGTSLRDRFALAALPWCLSEFGGNPEDQTQYGGAAYEVADAMLAARNRKSTDAKGEGHDE